MAARGDDFCAGKDAVLYVNEAQFSRAATSRRLGRNADAFVIGYEGPENFQVGHSKPFIGLVEDLHCYAVPLDAAQVGADRDGTLGTRPAEVADRSQPRLDPQAVPAAVAVVAAADAPLQASLIFSDPISATGIWYDAEGTKPGAIKVGDL